MACVTVATVGIGTYGLHLSRTTSDFYVASRVVSPAGNAAAISGEYLSAASFLGVAGLIMAHGVDMLWYPVGYASGYLMMLLLVAAPLRRSGAYTLPDFAEARLDSVLVRRTSSALVVVIGWFYLVPQLYGAGLTLGTLTGAPRWVGAVVVTGVVVANVVSGGMRSITLVQAFQFWLKLTAISVPAAFLLMTWQSQGAPTAGGGEWALPLAGAGGHVHPLYGTYSVALATFLGTMGLPHVLVRFYTNPDGRASRRTTLAVLGLLGVFYVIPPVYGALGRVYVPELLTTGNTDAVVLVLPQAVFGGVPGRLLGALVAAGAFAAFLSTSSGLTVSVAGVLSQDLLRGFGREFGRGHGRGRRHGFGHGPGRGAGPGSVRGFRLATFLAAMPPLGMVMLTGGVPIADSVALAFAVAASSFCPLLVLGIWWRGLTDVGAALGLVSGGGIAATAVFLTMLHPPVGGWAQSLLTQPAAVTVPIAFLAMVAGSLATRNRRPLHINKIMARMHAPEVLGLSRTDPGQG